MIEPPAGSFDLDERAVDLCASATEHGAVLVRRSGIAEPADLARFGRATGQPIEVFGEESSPRTPLGEGVATSTDYLAAYPIQMHNEFSYAKRWPRYVLFACLEPAATGGETPLSDSGAILRRLSDTTRATFAERGLMYERNYLAHTGVGWTKAFGTSDPAVVEAYGAAHGLRVTWQDDGSLTTRKVGQAVRRHPQTDEAVWFNHLLLFSPSGLEPTSLRRVFEREPDHRRSSNVYYGDGGLIPPEVFEEVREVTNAERQSWLWEPGDLLIVDNMLTAHGRMPYTGHRRVIVTMLGHWGEELIDEGCP